MIITAEFIGIGSLGYEHGNEYQLEISEVHGIVIQRLNGEGRCPYHSFAAFLRNWNNIRTV